jgi:hypothetical protein
MFQVPTPLRQLIPNATVDGVEIMCEMLRWNPQKRPSAQKALSHNFFTVGQNLQRMQQQKNNNVKPLYETPKPETVKPLNLNVSLNNNLKKQHQQQSNTTEIGKTEFEPKKPDVPKKSQDPMTRKRWGSSNLNNMQNAPKGSIDEFDSILDGLGSSTNSFINKRVSIQIVDI